MISDRLHVLGWLLLWAAAVVPALWIPLTPIDETRYAAVAWEMWSNGSFLVPLLNGEPYSHKPPLLFWLIQAGWTLFGVNEWWLRLIPALFALACVFLTRRLAQQLWPEDRSVAVLAPTLLLGMAPWVFFLPALMFDILLAFWVLVAVLGLLAVRRSGGAGGWILFAAATAFGLLTKGPVMLLHVLVPALLIPVLAEPRMPTQRWLAALAISIACALALALSWALPAAVAGGDEYARAILWGQTSGRMVDSFAHRSAWWWYLALLPLLLFPWLWWPRAWRAIGASLPRLRHDPGLRLCAAWAGLVFLAFTLISGKRIHYLIPLLPVISLCLARMIAILPQREGAGVRELAPVAAVFTVVALLFALAPLLQAGAELPSWVVRISPAMIAVALGAAIVLLIPGADTGSPARALRISAVLVIFVSLARALADGEVGAGLDMQTTGGFLHSSEQSGIAVAHAGRYHGQFTFSGRLTRSLRQLDNGEVAGWLAEHPDGQIILYQSEAPDPGSEPPLFAAPYRDKWVVIRTAASAARFMPASDSGRMMSLSDMTGDPQDVDRNTQVQ